MRLLSKLSFVVTCCIASVFAQGPDGAPPVSTPGVWISEIVMDVAGADNGWESIEIQSATPNFSLDGLWLVIIEGDGTGAGNIDVRISLTGKSTGSNGVCLLRDSVNVIAPGPDAGTNVYIADWPINGSAFSGDIENGSQTFVLQAGTPPALNTDIDPLNNGVIVPIVMNGLIHDAIGFVENDSLNINVAYSFSGGAIVGGGPSPIYGPNPGFNADTLYRLRAASGGPAGWVGSDVVNVGATPATGLRYLVTNMSGMSSAGRPSAQTVDSTNTGVRWVDLGRPNLCVADLALSSGPPTVLPPPTGTFSFSISAPVAAGLTAYTALSFDPANQTVSTAYKGNFFGLWISEVDLIGQYSFGSPFVANLSASGTFSFSAEYTLPLMGTALTVYAVTVIPDAPYAGQTRIVAQSPVMSTTLF